MWNAYKKKWNAYMKVKMPIRGIFVLTATCSIGGPFGGRIVRRLVVQTGSPVSQEGYRFLSVKTWGPEGGRGPLRVPL